MSECRGPGCNLIRLQQLAAIKLYDRAIKAAYDEGYLVDADLLLDERAELLRFINDRS